MEGLFEQINGYCERTDFTYWAEPLNAVTNAAFLVAAIIMWRRVSDPFGRALCVILFAIGIGSYLFHTHATVWAVILDVLPILLFVLLYIFVANYRFWNLSLTWAIIATLLYFPYAALIGATLGQHPFFAISGQYWPLPIMIGAYGIALLRRYPETGRGLIIGALILVTSLLFRSVDEIYCENWPMGTHLWWHILNGVMLGWMIEVYRRHMLAAGARQS